MDFVTTDGATRTSFQLSAQLKTRLSYAMVKVQNGWEQNTIEELEHLPSARNTPMPATPTHVLEHPLLSATTTSSSSSPWRRPRACSNTTTRRPSVASESESRYLTSPAGSSNAASPFRAVPAPLSSQPLQQQQQQPFPSPYHPHSSWPQATHHQSHHSADAATMAAKVTLHASLPPLKATGLAPAPDILSPPRQRRRSSFTNRAPPPLQPTRKSGHASMSGARTTPSTPITASSPRRQGILRMPSQQAEKDAVDTLLFMSGSPNNSANMKFSGGAPQPSPLRAEFPLTSSAALKRVAFEDVEDVQMDAPGDREGEWLAQLRREGNRFGQL